MASGDRRQARATSGAGEITNGTDWCTGWGLVDLVLVAAATDDGRVVFALVEARDRPGLTASEPLALAALA